MRKIIFLLFILLALPLYAVDTEAPAEPMVTARDNPSDDGTKILVSWFTGSEGDIDRFMLYYSSMEFTNITTIPASNKVRIDDAATSSYTITGLTVDTNYWVAVTAVDEAGNESAATIVGPVMTKKNIIDIGPPYPYPPDPQPYPVDPEEGGEFESPYFPNTKIIIPPYALSGDSITIEIGNPDIATLQEIYQSGNKTDVVVNLDVATALNGTVVDFKLNNGYLIPGKKVTIQISYFGAPISAAVEPYLRIFYFNPSTSQWELAAGQSSASVNVSYKYVRIQVEHLSVYRIFAIIEANSDLQNIVVYPNPFKPTDGNTETGTSSQGITFSKLTKNATINIYTLSGELVTTIEETNGDGQAVWYARNNKDNNVASGIYIYLITNSQGEKRIGKLAIIR